VSTAQLPRSRTSRYVEHVMGLPVSLALRGRHTDDAAAHRAWARVVAALRDAGFEPEVEHWELSDWPPGTYYPIVTARKRGNE
jgi:hypothetical protein